MTEYIKNDGYDWFRTTVGPAQDIAHTGSPGPTGPAGQLGVSSEQLISKRIYLIRAEQRIQTRVGRPQDVVYIKLDTSIIKPPQSGNINYYLEGYLLNSTVNLYYTNDINIDPHQTLIDSISDFGSLILSYYVIQIVLPSYPFINYVTIEVDGVNFGEGLFHKCAGIRFYAEWST